MLALCNCSSGDEYGRNATGKITLAVEADKTIAQSVVSRATTPHMPVLNSLTPDKLTVSLTNKSGSYSHTWSSHNEFPEDEEFPADTYTMTASYGNTDAEGFESPQLYGEVSFPVVAGKVTPVRLTATVANSLIMFEPTEKFLDYFQSARFVLNTAAGNSLVVNPGETRPVYINPGNARIDARVVMPSGADALITIGYFTAKKATLHRITLDVEASTGTATLTVNFYDTFSNVESITIDLTKDLESLVPLPIPVVTPEGFEGNSAVDLRETYSGDYAFNIATRAGLAAATLSVADGDGEPEVYNMLDDKDAESLANKGLRTLNLKPDCEFSKIYLKDFVASLRCKSRDANSSKTITLSVTDRLGRTTDQTLADNNTLKVNLSPVTLSIEAVKDVIVHPTYQVKVQYNGSDIEKWMKFNTISKTGTKNSISDQKPQKVDGKDDEFIYTFRTPYREDDEKNNVYSNFKVECGLTDGDGRFSDNLAETGSIVIPEYKATLDSRDIWARKATITITPKSGYDQYKDLIADALVTSGIGAEHLVNRNGNKFIVDVENLEPGTYYDIAFSLNGYNPIHKGFTTERPLQLPNADMETWSRQDGKTQYWWIEYPGSDNNAEWGTMNLLTTSEGGNRKDIFNRNGCAYSAISGTIKTSDSHTKDNAALIRTVGWGGGNSAAASSGFGTCEHVTAGELYLGVYNSNTKAPEYNGISFKSRPSSIEFWYKYKTVTANDDFAEVEIILYDENGSPITTSSSYRKLDRVDNYTKVAVDIKYIESAPISSKIMVRFKSSGNSEALKANSTYMTPPPARNLSDGQYMGSQLYIDDIQLIY